MNEKELISLAVKYRKNNNLTQKDISENSGLTQQQISKLETCEQIPKLDTFLKYIKSLGLCAKLFETQV